MPSERTQRQMDRLLDEAEQAIAKQDWGAVASIAEQVLAFDDANADAQSFLEAAKRLLGGAPPSDARAIPRHSPTPQGSPQSLSQPVLLRRMSTRFRDTVRVRVQQGSA